MYDGIFSDWSLIILFVQYSFRIENISSWGLNMQWSSFRKTFYCFVCNYEVKLIWRSRSKVISHGNSLVPCYIGYVNILE